MMRHRSLELSTPLRTSEVGWEFKGVLHLITGQHRFLPERVNSLGSMLSGQWPNKLCPGLMSHNHHQSRLIGLLKLLSRSLSPCFCLPAAIFHALKTNDLRGHPTESRIQQLHEHLGMKKKGWGQNNREIQSACSPEAVLEQTCYTRSNGQDMCLPHPFKIIQGRVESGRINRLIRLLGILSQGEQ